MQVNETLAEGLKRELKVTIPASELDARLSERLEELKSRVRIKGFRPGKVPVAHLRRVYGKAAMAKTNSSLAIEPGPARVRPAMTEAVGHAIEILP